MRGSRRAAAGEGGSRCMLARTSRLVQSAACVVLVAAVAACGKKGPPLPPIVRIPAAPEQMTAQRLGNEVYVTVPIPGANVDGTVPADLGRVEVYGYTGTAPPPRGRFLEVARLVATIPAAPPPRPDEPLPAGPSAAGAVQRSSVTIRDTLTADELAARPLPLPQTERRTFAPTAAASGAPTARSADVAPSLRRFYLAIAFSPRGVPSPQTSMAELPLTELPDQPVGLRATYTEEAVVLSWEPAGGLVGFLVDRAAPLEPPPVDGAPAGAVIARAAPPGQPAADRSSGGLEPVPAGPTRYHVFRQVAPDPLELPPQAPPAWQTDTPAPITMVPIESLQFSDPVLLDGRARCYHVRAVRGDGGAAVLSTPSEPACVTPIDVFPPAPPANLVAVPGDGAITLIWDANVEPDLAGYLILRGAAGGDTLTPLTHTPVVEPRFTDRSVQRGIRYVYEVVAVDSRVPVANRSAPARVEETAR